MTRPTWDQVWISFAKTISERSYDPRNKVGAVIVTEDNTQVLGVGYNGGYAGGPNEVESMDPGKSGTIHAEINALIKMNYSHHKRKKLYVTLSPCRACAKAIVNGGIDELVYMDEYRDASGLNLLRTTDILVRQFKEK
jgi:dCMP deaminase